MSPDEQGDKVGKRTPMFARFSTVTGEGGYADTDRDVRGFALKFYTEEGNYDLVGNDTPVFFVRDPMKFPDFIHSQERMPDTGLGSQSSELEYFSYLALVQSSGQERKKRYQREYFDFAGRDTLNMYNKTYLQGVLLMLQRTVSYTSLLCVLGGGFLLYGFYLIVLVLTSQIDVSGSVQYTGPLIFEDPNTVRNYLFCGGLFLGNLALPGSLNTFGPLTPGPLLWVSIGMLCLSVTSMRVNVVYVCLQIALWLISLSVWFPIFYLLGSSNYDPGSFVPFVLITLALSLALLASYKPVIHFLRKLFGLHGAALRSATPVTKDSAH